MTRGSLFGYSAASAAFKALSIHPPLYRALGNTVGAARRSRRGLTQSYIDRTARMRKAYPELGLRSEARIMELGTGWMHWEALSLRLFFDVSGVLYDVWDNRQLAPLQAYWAQFDTVIEERLGLSAAEAKRAHGVIDQIVRAGSLNEVYDRLGFEYLLDPKGDLAAVDSGEFDLVLSFNVLEHVDGAALPSFTRNLARALRPGGLSFQWIDISDHISNFVRGSHRKEYLRLGETTYRRFYDSRVQYINRVQRPEWLQLFEDAGLVLVDETTRHCEIGDLPVAEQYRHLDPEDLSCITLEVVHRKPETTATAVEDGSAGTT